MKSFEGGRLDVMESRILWAVGKVGIVKYAWVCVYTPVFARSRKGREEIRKLWKDVNVCVIGIGRETSIMLIGDINGRVGNNEVAGVTGMWVVDEVNEIGEYLEDTCDERGLFLSNTHF